MSDQLERDDQDSFDLTPPEVAVPSRLDLMAAELPPEYEGPWIACLVQSFGGARDVGEDVLEDLFQSACHAAAEAIEEARKKGGVTEAYVKTAVRNILTDANRRFDTFSKYIEYAEDGPREPDSNPNERLIEEFGAFKYSPSADKRIEMVRIASYLVSYDSLRYWHAFCDTDGRCASIARHLGTTPYYVQHAIAPRARAEFREALELIAFIRGVKL